MTDYNFSIDIEQRTPGNDKIFQLNFIPKLVVTNDRCFAMSLDEKVYNSYQMKKDFRGQTFVKFPIVFQNNKVYETSDEKEYDGYIVVSKREIREEYHFLMRAKSDELNKHINQCKDIFIQNLNLYLGGHAYCVKYTYGDNNYIHHFVITDNKDELIDKIKSELDFIDGDFDKALENFVNNNCTQMSLVNEGSN